ncbi:PRD domain-containing protein [Enterococcus sp. HY326]|uniref:PRD domain-containing protein n=1 Tax=Enterococcus sp. HY326 TaxID=2971265 RepID=UPI00223F1FA8|nr:PRD domain-containing protein [Enterococcus sp. HY326]
MKVKQVYNNNVLLAEDNHHNELILLGKGIGFGLKKGDEVTPKQVEKIFKLSKEEQFKFQEIVNTLPLDYIMISDQLVQIIKSKLGESISDSIYITLTDHIYNIMERYQRGIFFDKHVLANIKRLYAREYQVALVCVALLRKELDVKIPDEEANFIALHIVAAESQVDFVDLDLLSQMTEQLLAVINNCFPKLDKASYRYERLSLECRFFAKKVMENQRKEQNRHTEEDVANFETKYQVEFHCVYQITVLFKQRYQYSISLDDQIFLLMQLIQLDL